MPAWRTLARISATWRTSSAGSPPASVWRKLVCTQRMGSRIHQPCAAAAWIVSNAAATGRSHRPHDRRLAAGGLAALRFTTSVLESTAVIHTLIIHRVVLWLV